MRGRPAEDANKGITNANSGINVTSHVTINIEPPQAPETETIPLEIYERSPKIWSHKNRSSYDGDVSNNLESEHEGEDISSEKYLTVCPKVKSYYADIISELELKHGKENIPY